MPKGWKIMARNDNDNADMLQQEIRKQIGSPSTRRFARSLPAFRIDTTIPEHFSRLLAELEYAERNQQQPASASE